MKKVLVPKDKCPLDVIAEMGERTSNAWIFIHIEAAKKLMNESDEVEIHRNQGEVYSIEASFKATEEYPKTSIWLCHTANCNWKMVVKIDAEDIAFKTPSDEPDEIFLIQMEE